MMYKLVDKVPVPCSVEELCKMKDNYRERVVGQTRVGETNQFVSTVFLEIDHGQDAQGRPLLFETMVFDLNPNGSHTGNELYCKRYATWEEAEEGHRKAVEMTRQFEFFRTQDSDETLLVD